MNTKIAGVLVIAGGLVCLYSSTQLESRIARIALAATAFGMFSGGSNLIKYSRRQVQLSAEELQARDPRPPVFYLRAFNRDNEKARVPFKLGDSNMLSSSYYMSRSTTTVEESMVSKLQEIGPVIALGRSKETLQPLGASRAYVSDSDWQESFREIVGAAALIVMAVDDTDSLRWELEEIFRLNKLDRLILVLSRRALASRPDVEGKDLQTWGKLRTTFPILPEISEATVAVSFDVGHHPSTYQSVKAAITAYASAKGI